MVGPDLNEKICSQISPAGASLVDKEDFHATCSADRTEASSSFEPDEKDHHRLMIYRNRLPAQETKSSYRLRKAEICLCDTD